MDVVRDVLDKFIVDRNGREMGRVDGILLEVRDNEPPRLAEVLIGASVLGFRFKPLIGQLVHGIECALGLGDERPIGLKFSDVDAIGDKVKIDLPIGETGADTFERRVRRWLVNIPGSR